MNGKKEEAGKILQVINPNRSVEEMIEEDHQVMVRWHYPEEDEDMLEAGEEYSEMVDVPFEMVSYS